MQTNTQQCSFKKKKLRLCLTNLYSYTFRNRYLLSNDSLCTIISISRYYNDTFNFVKKKIIHGIVYLLLDYIALQV